MGRLDAISKQRIFNERIDKGLKPYRFTVGQCRRESSDPGLEDVWDACAEKFPQWFTTLMKGTVWLDGTVTLEKAVENMVRDAALLQLKSVLRFLHMEETPEGKEIALSVIRRNAWFSRLIPKVTVEEGFTVNPGEVRFKATIVFVVSSALADHIPPRASIGVEINAASAGS